ncbi:glycosyltransferase [Paenibacillus sp. HN-1]|uniref:MGDG synthase family glycosyltransferase n=1 Tax=Paenibacillus TaxID=44249 RepID=UPI001CA91184|nr:MULTISPECIES: glycosyltransferase [Paenibacillus]MBY9079303.1 glycosyltransferase [Paenibacillus sp. CGMCC 1.18879]MBY9087026.1 glycosyltransferase [Paenibacillus sinensis]
MNPDPVVLIVSAAYGGGHAKVAQAIEQSFRSRNIAKVHVLDLFGEVHPVLNGLSRAFYLKSSEYAPHVYGALYNMTSGMKPEYPFGRMLHSLGRHKVRRILNELRPDAIIHTFPYLAASQLSAGPGEGVPVFTVVTDYCLHGRWIHPTTSKYFIAADYIKDDMLKAGVSGERIEVSGIPVREAFTLPQERTELIRKHGLQPDRKYVMLSAGAYGVTSRIRALIRRVLRETELDLLVLCGSNHKLRRSLMEQYGASDRVRVLGYTEDIHELMSLSSCLLTKAGGVTLTEAFAMSLPVIVYKPLPGQEAGNAKALESREAIFVAGDEEELMDRLRRMDSDTALESLKLKMQEFSRSDAAGAIVNEVLRVLNERPVYGYSSTASTAPKNQPETAHS